MENSAPSYEDWTLANHKQAEKRNRQRIKRRARNLMYLSTMRTYIKRLRSALDDAKLDDAQAALSPALKSIGKAAQKGVIHKNTAARYSSRLSLAVNRLAKSGS